MEWKNSHLHEFKVNKERYIGPQSPVDNITKGTLLDEKKTRLSEFLSKRGDSLLYIYDFGDNWVHQLLVEAVRQLPPANSSEFARGLSKDKS